MAYPADLSRKKPTILAFVDINDRRNDELFKPLRALSARDGLDVVAVLTYDKNSFLKEITTQDELRYLVILDPDKKLCKRLGVDEFPTFLFITPKYKVLDRCSDITKAHEWCRSTWVQRALEKEEKPSPEEMVNSD